MSQPRRRHCRLSRLASIACLALAACGGGGGGPSNQQIAANLVAEAFQRLLAGDEDFAGIAARLRQARDRDGGNANAPLFLALAETLDYLKSTAMGGAGELRSLYTRAGFDGPPDGGSFWGFALRERAHGQGHIADGAPRAGDLARFLANGLLPRLEALIAALEAVRPGFTWRIRTQDLASHPLSGGVTAGAPPEYELDYGDLQALAAGLNVLVAHARFLLGYDHNDVDPNDFDSGDDPNLDPLLVIEQAYPQLGRVADASQLQACRDRLTRAWDDYLQASAHIRGESAAQQQVGLLTLQPGVFLEAGELAQFVADEAAFRSWAGGIVAAFTQNVGHLIDRGPDGQPLPPEDHWVINFFRLFEGVGFRDVYFRIVNDPFAGRHRIGVTGLDQITPAMVSAAGLVVGVAGTTPTAGDLQTDGRIALRIDAPPTSTKVIDGSHADWATGAVQIGGAPRATIAPGNANLGGIWAARDAGNLFLRIDADLMAVLGTAGSAELAIEWWQGPNRFVSYIHLVPGGGPPFVSSTAGSDPVVAVSGEGLEAAIPAPAGALETWASLRVAVQVWTTGLHNERSGMLVRVR